LIAVVTGASRGAGRGIAIALGALGATVYVTGRSVADGDSPHGGTIRETADLVTSSGGRGVAVAVDHEDDGAVAALFERVKAQHGRMDVLVNNAAKLVSDPAPGGFWEKPVEAAEVITVGLRSHFIAAYYAAPLLITNGHGPDREHRLLWSCFLSLRPSLRRAESRCRQDGCRYGERTKALQCCSNFYLDGAS